MRTIPNAIIVLALVSRAMATDIAHQEVHLINPTSGARLWAAVSHPSDASPNRKYPAVVFVPGGLGFGSQIAHGPQVAEIASAGFVIGCFDPDGRGRSEGRENWNGKVHQDGLHAFLKQIAGLPFVDQTNVGVVSSSLGVALAAGALGRHPDNPPIKYFIDIEGPSDRFYITKNNDPHFLRIFAGRTTDDKAWWVEREAVNSIRDVVCPYLRIQHERDHVHGENKQHALDMIVAATCSQRGGKGRSPWTRINGKENPPNRIYTVDSPPKWLPTLAGVPPPSETLQWIREMAAQGDGRAAGGDRPRPLAKEEHLPAPQSNTPRASGTERPFAIFFAVHCEPATANPALWDALGRFVAMADGYGARLTLMFNPQWAELILAREGRLQRLKSWQQKGHEIAAHYHNVVHGAWNGYTNRGDENLTRDPRYRGTVPVMMGLLQKLASPDTILTMCMGPDARWDSLIAVEIDTQDYPDGILYDVDGMDVGLARPVKTRFKDRDLFHLKHHFIAPGPRASHLEAIKAEFHRAGPDDVLGVVTHDVDFARSPQFIEQWFLFCRVNKVAIQTVREIIKSYPQDRILAVGCVAQEPHRFPAQKVRTTPTD